jgi:glycolate oxidase iron-sulfur subunit
MPLPRPPSADPLIALADRCVQCGLCLPACPTYGHDRIEAESARGRIALARGWALQALEPTDAGDAHLDHCLACRSCEAVCPAGVQYGALLREARRRQRERRGAGIVQRLIERLAAQPALLRALLAAYRLAWPLLPSALRPLPRPPARGMHAQRTGASGRGRPAIALFTGCVAPAYEASTHAALARLFDACGIELRVPSAQTCCGTLHAHAGDAAAARRLAERNAAAFVGATQVVTIASGCHEAVCAALASHVPVADALEVLGAAAAKLRFRRCEERIALHLPCTQRNVVRSGDSLRRLLDRIPGLDVVTLDAGFGCCGAAGTSMFTDPARAASFRAPPIAQLDASRATRLLSANIGCRLHLANGTAMTVQHPIDFLAEQLDTSC